MKALAILLVLLAGVVFAQERFSVSGGVITDNNTGLEWRVGPDRNTNWYEAKAWVEGLGGNWRMPTRAELRGLWDAGIGIYEAPLNRYKWGPFENNGYWVWSSEVRDSESAWVFDFPNGREEWVPRSPCNPGVTAYTRAFAVRRR